MTDPKTNARKPGARKSDFSDESNTKVLKVAKTLVRTDWGGKSGIDIIRKKGLERGLDLGPESCKFIQELCEEQVSGCRQRINPRIDEVIRRCGEEELVIKEKSP